MSNGKEITIRLRKIKEYLAIVKRISGTCSLSEIKKDVVLQGALERYMQLMAEAAIDVGEIIIAERDSKTPEFNRDVFVILGSEKVIPKDLSRRLVKMAGFRNILVHDYVEVDIDKLYRCAKTNIKDVEQFVTYIARFVKKSTNRGKKK